MLISVLNVVLIYLTVRRAECAHTYFAYGSTLCVRQMARRCPGAVDPAARDAGRPRLADQRTRGGHRRTVRRVPGARRGVAGDRPRPGHAGQRRRRVGAVSPRPAGRAHRRRPAPGVGLHRSPRRAGPPRPGLPGAHVDGALHHGLPQRWIEFLRRWDPANWPHALRAKSSPPAPLSLGTARRPGRHRGQHAALAVRLPGASTAADWSR